MERRDLWAVGALAAFILFLIVYGLWPRLM